MILKYQALFSADGCF